MQAIELQTKISQDGTIHLPQQYRHLYGQRVRVIILLPDEAPAQTRRTDLTHDSHMGDGPINGMADQNKARSEWE